MTTSDPDALEARFYVASLTHTLSRRSHRRRAFYITFWRPKDCGYCWPLSWAGEYPASRIDEHPTYYNDGHGNIAVPVEAVRAIAIPPVPGEIDGNAGPVVMNTEENWRKLRACRYLTAREPGVTGKGEGEQ